jgi:hypothetical protein
LLKAPITTTPSEAALDNPSQARGRMSLIPAISGLFNWGQFEAEVAQTECKGMHSRLDSAVDRNICHRSECQS